MHETEKIREFIIQELMHGDDGAGVGDDESLLERGILDSLGLLHLLAFLEQEYQVLIEDQDIVPENFESVSAIARLVGRRPGELTSSRA